MCISTFRPNSTKSIFKSFSFFLSFIIFIGLIPISTNLIAYATTAPSYILIGDAETQNAANLTYYTDGEEFLSQIKINDVTNDNYITLPAPTITTTGTGTEYRSYIDFEVKVNQTEHNYLTVKLWGGDVSSGNGNMLWLVDPDTYCAPGTNLAPIRSGIVDRQYMVELDTLGGSPQVDNGYVYTTYDLGEKFTNGKESVKLRIYSTGGPSDYATPNIKVQNTDSRGIYGIYVSQTPYFVAEKLDPEYKEQYSNKPVPNLNSVLNDTDIKAQRTQMINIAKEGVSIFMNRQIYSGSNYPSYMKGMPTRTTSWSGKSESDANWKDSYYNTGSGSLAQNMTPLAASEMFSKAYLNADILGYNESTKSELLDRIVAEVDFLVRAQGKNGGFFTSSNAWIGGPTRIDAGGNNLTGFGLRSVGQSVLDVYDEIVENGYLNENIDHNADEVIDTDMTRAQAWARMFATSRDFLYSVHGAGHAPNQDMANILALLRFNMCIQKLEDDTRVSSVTKNALTFPSLAYDDKVNTTYKSWRLDNGSTELQEMVDIGLGREKNKSTSNYWVSPNGIILENLGSSSGGYSGDYGTSAITELSEIIELAICFYPEKEDFYISLLDNAYNAIDNFLFLANSQNDKLSTQYAEGLISTRNRHYPGSARYLYDSHGALKTKNKTALKMLQNYFEHNSISTDNAGFTSGAHFEDNAINNIKLVSEMDEVIDSIKTNNIIDYDFAPMRDEDFTFADEMAKTVVIKHNGELVYVALNWRSPLHSQYFYNNSTVTSGNTQTKYFDYIRLKANNLARVHRVTDTYETFGYADMNTDGVNNIDDNDYTYINKEARKEITNLDTGVTTTQYEAKAEASDNNGYFETLMSCKYGIYNIIMNTYNAGREYGAFKGDGYDYTWDGVTKSKAAILLDNGNYIDLISGETYTKSSDTSFVKDNDKSNFVIDSNTTMVLVNLNDYKSEDKEEKDLTIYASGDRQLRGDNTKQLASADTYEIRTANLDFSNFNNQFVVLQKFDISELATHDKKVKTVRLRTTTEREKGSERLNLWSFDYDWSGSVDDDATNQYANHTDNIQNTTSDINNRITSFSMNGVSNKMILDGYNGTAKSTTESISTWQNTTDITSYIKQAIESGKTEVSFLYTNPKSGTGQEVMFSSKVANWSKLDTLFSKFNLTESNTPDLEPQLLVTYEDIQYEAKIESTLYETLDEALSDSVDGDTIEVLSDCSITSRVNIIDKSITITANQPVIINTLVSDITFAVTNSSEEVGTLTIDGKNNITIDGSSITDGTQKLIEINGGASGIINDINMQNYLTNGTQGVLCTKSNSNLTINNVSFSNCVSTNANTPCVIFDGASLTLGGNNTFDPKSTSPNIYTEDRDISVFDITNDTPITIKRKNSVSRASFIYKNELGTIAPLPNQFELINTGFILVQNGDNIDLVDEISILPTASPTAKPTASPTDKPTNPPITHPTYINNWDISNFDTTNNTVSIENIVGLNETTKGGENFIIYVAVYDSDTYNHMCDIDVIGLTTEENINIYDNLPVDIDIGTLTGDQKIKIYIWDKNISPILKTPYTYIAN